MPHPRSGRALATALLLGTALLCAGLSPKIVHGDEANASPASGHRGGGGHNYPPIDQVTEGYDKVVSTADGSQSMYTVWVRKRDGQMLAELPRDFDRHRYFIALTVASGENYAGLQAGDMYVYWKQFDNRLALIEPNVETRSTGDPESKSSVQRLFTDRVVLDVPILTIPPQRGPVIDLDDLLLGHANRFFGSHVAGLNSRLATVKTAKAFPHNIEIGVEVPVGSDGRLKTLHYSISLIPDNSSYKPRVADERVGYFITAYSDLGKYKERESRVRYINRWSLEKADPTLEISPPKNPIVFYIEHTTPIRYRRWVREGIVSWNKAFEKVGLSNAIEVYYQDAASSSHMEKDPEDVRYNFVRWLNNNVGTAIGPSRVHPLTGQILDADIILTDGWIRHFWKQYREVLPELALEGFSPETLAWLDTHPKWDPRIRLAPASERDRLLFDRARQGTLPYGGHPLAQTDAKLMGSHEFDGLTGRISQTNGLCLASRGKALDVGLMRMLLDVADDAPKTGDGKKDGEGPKIDKPKDKEKLIDDMPESFIGPLLAELVMHEVGHTLGLRHNFKSSSAYTMAEINSKTFKGTKVTAGSVMDYLPININVESGEVQGDWCMTGIGPYDYWAIEYGYTMKDDLKPVLERVAEPGLAYATDEDTWGPDPLARRYDFSKNPLDYAKNQLRLAKYHRQRIIDKFVKDGESWSKARGGYEMTLSLQTQSVSTMARWVGGAFVNRDRKGDKNGRPPIEVVPAQQQRDALKWIIETTFFDDSFGLTPDLLRRMTVDQWLDGEGRRLVLGDEATWPVHDRIMGIQASTLTMLMNPTTLRRVYDNEYRVPADQDAVTLPELLGALSDAIWKELDQPAPDQPYSARKPMISSLRRNLQREHLERLIDLILPGNDVSAARKPIATLGVAELKKIQAKLSQALEKLGPKADPYTVAHLTEAREEIKKALDAQVIYNAKEIGHGGGMPFIIFSQEAKEKE